MRNVIVSLCLAHAALAAPIGALIIDGQNNHNWKATTPVLKKILEDNGLFQVDVLTTPPKGGDFSTFKPDFKKYKVIVLNYNEFPTGDKWPEAVRTSFEEWMRNGGGLVSYHAADNAFPDWSEYNLMIGIGGWLGRTEKSGPYWYYHDGKLASDTTPGNAGNHGARTPFEIDLNRRQDGQHDERQPSRDRGEHQMSRPGGHPDRRVHPDRRRGRHAVDGIAAAENGATPQKPDSGDDLRRDPVGGSRFASHEA